MSGGTVVHRVWGVEAGQYPSGLGEMRDAEAEEGSLAHPEAGTGRGGPEPGISQMDTGQHADRAQDDPVQGIDDPHHPQHATDFPTPEQDHSADMFAGLNMGYAKQWRLIHQYQA